MIVPRAYIFAFACFLLFSARSFAEPEVNVWISDSSPTAGDSVTMRVSAMWPSAEASYVFALPRLSLENLEIHRQGESLETFVIGDVTYRRKIFSFELTAPQTGEARIEAFDLTYVDPSGGGGGILPVDEQKLKIKKPPFVFSKYAKPAIFAASAILVFVIAFIFYRSRVKQQKNVQSLVIKKEYAVSELPSDKIEDLFGQLKRIILTRLNVQVLRPTEGELIGLIKASDIPKREKNLYENWLLRIAELKFSDSLMVQEECKQLQKELNQMVQTDPGISHHAKPVH